MSEGSTTRTLAGRDGRILSLVDVADLDDDTFSRFYDEVMVPSFPPAELVTPAELREAAAEDPGAVYTVALSAGDPVAGVLADRSAGSGVILLSYLAVRPDLRGSGIASQVLGTELPRWRQMFPSSPVVAEVADPRCHQADQYGDPEARLRFYQRHQARVVPLPYFQPSLRPGSPRVEGMLLLTFGAAETMPTATLTGFLDDYFAAYEGYDQVRVEPRYRRLRAALAGWTDGVVPLWPLDRLPEIPTSVDALPGPRP